MWIHLIATTALLFVVLPRLLLATWSSLKLARVSRTLAPPESLLPYVRTVLGASDAAPAPVAVRVTPYAYQPATASLEGLRTLLRTAYGPGTRMDLAEPVTYGNEAAVRELAAGGVHNVDAVLFTLAATPEAENHGAMMAGTRDALARVRSAARLLVLVDESPFLAHMQADASLATRVEERRGAWREFGARHGCEVCTVDLVAMAREPGPPGALVEQLRSAARAVLA